jgi:hypothetical protein
MLAVCKISPRTLGVQVAPHVGGRLSPTLSHTSLHSGLLITKLSKILYRLADNVHPLSDLVDPYPFILSPRFAFQQDRANPSEK